MKQALARLGEKNYENMGVKLWRRSKATEMARQGHSLGEVLTAGESRAILNYVQESAIDSAALLQETLNLSEDEAEEVRTSALRWRSSASDGGGATVGKECDPSGFPRKVFELLTRLGSRRA